MKKWLVSIVLLFSVVQANCTHLRAGYITYEVIDLANRTYKITVTVYTDSGPTDPVLFGEGILDFGDGTSPMQLPIVENDTRHTILPDGSFTSEPLDASDFVSGVSKAQFVIEHTFFSTGRFVIVYTEPNRNEGILNIDN